MSWATKSGTCTPRRSRFLHHRTARTTSIGDSARTAERSNPPRGRAMAGSLSRSEGTGMGQPGDVVVTISAPLVAACRVGRVVAGDGVDVGLHVDLLHAVPVGRRILLVDRVLALDLGDVVRAHPVDEIAGPLLVAARPDGTVRVLLPRVVHDVPVGGAAHLAPVARVGPLPSADDVAVLLDEVQIPVDGAVVDANPSLSRRHLARLDVLELGARTSTTGKRDARARHRERHPETPQPAASSHGRQPTKSPPEALNLNFSSHPHAVASSPPSSLSSSRAAP